MQRWVLTPTGTQQSPSNRPTLSRGSPPRRDDADDDEADEAPDRFDRWRKESAIGNVGTGIARGLQAVFAPPAHEIAIVAEAPGEPPDADQRLRVILDPDDPTKSIAMVPAPPTGTGPEADAGTPPSG